MDKSPDIAAGSQLGPYQLIEPLGRGASATVYLAKDREGRSWAVKARRRGMATMDRRFLREFESMRLLRVPGVVRVHEAGVQDDVLWFSMELVYGRPFIDVVHEQKFLADRVRVATDFTNQLMEILSRLHEAGFIHRDVKPSNVLVDKEGKVHVLDFGIGRYFSDHTDTLSHSGEVLGTIPFMAPEQIAGLPIDERIDLFAAGTMLYEAIAGKRPRPKTTVGWIPRICMDRLEPLACQFREVPLALSKLVERLTSIYPADRPSARQAAHSLRAIHNGIEGQEWPDPAFIDPGTWWLPLEGCLGHSGHPPVYILDGRSGSGRGRIAEQIHRLGLMQGVWPLHMHCRIDSAGEPLNELLSEILQESEEGWSAAVVGDDADRLRQVWPHLPLPGSSNRQELPTADELADAVARVVERAAERRQLLLFVHALEDIDNVTERALNKLAELSGPKLGMLILHEPRWSTSESTALIASLRSQHGAGYLRVPSLDKETAAKIASSLCPKASPPRVRPGAVALDAIEAGLSALARWRKQPLPEPSDDLWPLAVQSPMPEKVFRKLAGPEPWSEWISQSEQGVELSGSTAEGLAHASLSDRRRAAARVARALETFGGDRGQLARLHLLAGDHRGAWAPAAQAALDAARFGRFREARQWLLILDTLPTDAQVSDELSFQLAMGQAEVALQTESGAPRMELTQKAEAMARDDAQRHRSRVLRCEFLVREGQVKHALVTLLRLLSKRSELANDVAAQALLTVIDCRLSLRQFPEAERDIERIAKLVKRGNIDVLHRLKARDLQAELRFLQHDLAQSRSLCQKLIRAASQAGYVRGVAFAASRLGQVLRMMGRRREAEHQTRSAREAFAATGDLVLDARTGLALATLLCERGDAVAARHLLDETIRRIRSLNLEHLIPSAMRVTLQAATLRADPTDAALALSSLAAAPGNDQEIPAAVVRWWRTRGEADRALDVVGPRANTYGRCLWHLERSRAALVGGLQELCAAEAETALADAARLEFQELVLYARLLLGVVTETTDEAWTELANEASESQNTELFLGALEMSARRLNAQGDQIGSRMKWRTLRARSTELGYRPGEQEAAGWLAT